MGSHLNEEEMRVKKRNGELETVSFDKILVRIKNVGKDAGIQINYTTLVMKVIDQLYDGISTSKIDELTAEQCASMASIHPDYNVLAARLIISGHQKNTDPRFSVAMRKLYDNVDIHGHKSPLISEELMRTVDEFSAELDAACDAAMDRDFLIDYFGFKTLERAYLMRVNRVCVERIQHMWLRVSLGIHGHDIGSALETYSYMSQKYFTHATPTLFNAGTPKPQLSSCFLLAMENDSIDGIYNTLKDCALISKMAGGIGLHIHNVRATGSYIRGTNGTSNGIVPMLRVFNNTAKYVDQCVTPDTLLYTTRGPIPICECVAGETEVINSTGQPEIVQNVLEHSYSGPMLRITVGQEEDKTREVLRITPEHPVFVVDEDGIYKWVDAKDLHIGDQVVSAIPQYSVDAPEFKEPDCIVYGIVYKYSCACNIYKLQIPVQDMNAHAQIKQYFASYSIGYTTHTCVVDDIEFIVYDWSPSTVCPIRQTHVFSKNGEKRVHHKILNLPVAKLLQTSAAADSAYVRLRLRDTLSKTGGQNVHRSVVAIETEEYSGIVYDLQMRTIHNYLLEGGLVHNGGGKRNGSFAIYLEPWHADIESFLEMRKNHGDEEQKARDLFYALWIPDLFMKRVNDNAQWTLMCPDECPGLADVYGDEFETLYTKYETAGRGKRTISARELWFKILDAQMETGTPYMCYKDAANKKSNQKNIGTIKSSNLCTEVMEVSTQDETAVCNLASMALPTYVQTRDTGPVFDYDGLYKATKVVVKNLNRVIDVNYYPTSKTRVSNMRHRPIGLGVQGLADVFFMLDTPFYSDFAKETNRLIFETIYYAALEASCELAIMNGPYESFDGSPASQGILQFDMWSVVPTPGRYDWAYLKDKIQEHGLRNSLLVAPMPTASTSQILGFNECIEPITSNIYSRRTNAGEFILANKYLLSDLIKQGLWNEQLKNNIVANNGSIQHLTHLPQEIRDKYKTVWEIPMRVLIDMSADRGAYVCQSQSLNLWLEDPNYKTLTSMHFYAWSKGLKTGIYYLRRRGRHQAQQFTIEPEKAKHADTIVEEDDVCEFCSA